MNLTEIRERQHVLNNELSILIIQEALLIEGVFSRQMKENNKQGYLTHLYAMKDIHADDKVLFDLIVSEIGDVLIALQTEAAIAQAHRSTQELHIAILNGDYNHLLDTKEK